jgi:FkbM family methyltransferase
MYSKEMTYFDNTTCRICDESLTFSIHSPFDITKSNGKIWEDKSIELFYTKYFKKDAKVIIDIGAQVGLYTLYAKKLTEATFYAFEPYDIELNILKENIELNNLQNIIVSGLAISDKRELKTLNVCKIHPGLNTLGANPLRWNPAQTETIQKQVNTETIDNLFFEYTCVDMIKIDTEGWEYYILQGAEKVILKDRPHIQIEWNLENMRQCNVNPIELETYIRTTLDYNIITHDGLEEVFLIPK